MRGKGGDRGLYSIELYIVEEGGLGRVGGWLSLFFDRYYVWNVFWFFYFKDGIF